MIVPRLRVFQPLQTVPWRKLKDSRARRISIIVAALACALLSAFSESADTLWAERTLKTLTLRDKIAQLVQIRVPGKFLNRNSSDFQKIQNDIKQNHVGGLVLFAGNIYESAVLLNDLQGISRLPLLVAGDFERGAAFRITDTTSFPWTMALGASGSERLAYRQGAVTARESRALGVHWIFAPVMDVNNNPDNPVINIRAFGEDPELVARLGSAFIRGAKSGGVLTTAKHFPGHGDTATDSHIGMPVVASDLSRLQSVELVPFRRAVEAGVDSIMTAHVAVPDLTGESQIPATLSPKILTGLLRDMLRFDGLVVTDALEMGGITGRFWGGLAAVRAIQAGADILLLPPDATVAIQEVERAVKRGDISESRIDESVRRLLKAKSRLGLHHSRAVSIKRIGDVIASPENQKLAQEIADQSITVLKDDRKLLPVDPTDYPRVFSLVLSPDLESTPGAAFQTEMRRRFPLIRTIWANARVSEDLLVSIDKAASESDLIVCSTLIRLVSGQNAAAIPDTHRRILDKLQATNKPLIWVAFGNPYVFKIAHRIGTYLCTFSYSDSSQVAAAKALAGEIGIGGKTPISIAGFFKTGDGITVPKLEMELKSPAAGDMVPSHEAFQSSIGLLDSLVEDALFPGAVLLVGQRGKIILNHAAGKNGYSANSAKTSSATVYDTGAFVQSVSLASAAMFAADSGNLLLNAPIDEYLPEMKEFAGSKLSLMDLLASRKDMESARAQRETIRSILARSLGVPLVPFLAEHLYRPIGMKSTFHKLPSTFRGGIAIPGKFPDSELFSSANDLAVFAQMLLNRGVYAHRRFFNLETIGRFTGYEGAWLKPSESDWTGKIFSARAFGCLSGSGSLLWVDPERHFFIILLANGKPDRDKIPEAQRKICESAIASLRE